MSIELVTGLATSNHITSMMDGARNAGMIGTGEYVLSNGNRFEASVISNNSIRILDGDGLMQGRHFTLAKGTYSDVTIDNGLQGMNRNDIIVARYVQNTTTGVESVSLEVVKGTSTAGTATDPAITTGDILTGECTQNDMPLYRVPITGLNVGTPVKLYTVINAMKDMTAADVKYNASTTVEQQFDKERGITTFSIATSNWIANTGDVKYPYKATKSSTVFSVNSQPIWCLATTSTTAGDTSLTDTDEEMDELITKAEFTSSNVTFYATAQVTSSVKISVKGV